MLVSTDQSFRINHNIRDQIVIQEYGWTLISWCDRYSWDTNAFCRKWLALDMNTLRGSGDGFCWETRDLPEKKTWKTLLSRPGGKHSVDTQRRLLSMAMLWETFCGVPEKRSMSTLLSQIILLYNLGEAFCGVPEKRPRSTLLSQRILLYNLGEAFCGIT